MPIDVRPEKKRREEEEFHKIEVFGNKLLEAVL